MSISCFALIGSVTFPERDSAVIGSNSSDIGAVYY